MTLVLNNWALISNCVTYLLVRTWHDPDQYLSHKITEDQAPGKDSDLLIKLQIFVVPFKTTVLKEAVMKDHKLCFGGEIIVLPTKTLPVCLQYKQQCIAHPYINAIVITLLWNWYMTRNLEAKIHG